MLQPPKPHVTLTTAELWLLLSQSGPAFVLGMENPYLGWLADEIEGAHKQAAESLLERGIAQKMTDETLEVDDMLMALVSTMSHPQHSLVLQISSPNGESEQRYIHFSENLIIEHRALPLDQHELFTYPDQQLLINYLINSLHLDPQIEGHGNAFQLPEANLFQAVELVANGKPNEIISLLRDAGLTKSEAAALQKTITNPIANASLAVIANQGDPDTQHVRGFGVLQSSTDLWLMCPFDRVGQPQIEFIPINAEGIRQRVEETVPLVFSMSEE
jgi:hypothetical protein